MLSTAVQPFSSVTVTMYVPSSVTEMLGEVSPEDHSNELAFGASAVNSITSPEQLGFAPPEITTSTSGPSKIVMLTILLSPIQSVQPWFLATRIKQVLSLNIPGS